METTKGRIAQSFKELLTKKSFQKITISDIAKECGMTRENFYYHFHDKYDIIRFILEKDLLEPASKISDFREWIGQIIFLAKKDRMTYVKIIREVGRTTIHDNFYPIMRERVKACVTEYTDSSVWNMRKEKISFATAFFTDAFIEFIFRSILDNEMAEMDLFNYNLEFLMSNFLPFVR